MNRMIAPGHAHRAFVLYAALIVVAIGALISSSVVYAAQAQRSSADAAARRVQSRAIAWSGVQAAMEALRVQRDDLLRGRGADLPEDWVMFTDADGRQAVARLVEQTDGALLVSEAGKLDVNTARAAMLAAVPGLDAEIASRIVAARAGRKFLSVHELAGIEGLRNALGGGSESADVPVKDAFVPPEDAELSRPLTDLLTVFSFDPNVQAGLGRNAESHTGVRRIALSVKWSERLARAITERFDEATANIVKALLEQGIKFEKESDIVKVLRRFNVQPADWAEVLDAYCVDAGPYRLGRIDIHSAPAEVLACVPGIDAAAAEQIALRRGKLAPEQRLTPVWLVQENILTQDQFELAVDALSSRSLQWRIVIEAGFVERGTDASSERPPLGDRIIVEAVLDVSSERARVAYLREITLADAARALGPLRAVTPQPKRTDSAPDESAPSGPEVQDPAISSTPGESAGERWARERAEARSARNTPPADAPGGDAGAEDAPLSQSEKDPRTGRWTPGQP